MGGGRRKRLLGGAMAGDENTNRGGTVVPSDIDARLTTILHAMGACVIACAVTFQLGVMSLEMGMEAVGYAFATMSAATAFVIMAAWRSYDLSAGKIDDMGVLFLAYQDGTERIARVVTRVASLVAIYGTVSAGFPLFALITFVIGLVVPTADRIVVGMSYLGTLDAEIRRVFEDTAETDTAGEQEDPDAPEARPSDARDRQNLDAEAATDDSRDQQTRDGQEAPLTGSGDEADTGSDITS